MANLATKEDILKKYFGFESFRAIQEKAIEHILKKRDLLTILPTGSGKSLIFQLPTLMMSGVTIVISPLIALMQDQVINLKQNGISAAMLSSTQNDEQNSYVIQQLQNKQLKFLYVAPERFTQDYFLNMIKNIDVNFFVIDEAHCVSEWGHEFRDDYRKLQFLKSNFPNISITAFTATATKAVELDILKTLSIDTSNVLRGKIQRTNLLIRAQKRVGDGKTQVINFLKAHKDECGIIYCFTRKETEQLSNFLNTKGFDTLAYHAGLNAQNRDEIFKSFKNESIKIIVATIAFGMGIDKGNIRFVLHTSMPKTLENYSQEIGRAGRDGLKSDVLLLYAKSDEMGKKRFIDELPESTYKINNYKKLDDMYRFCVSQKCRHQLIAKYFDDDIEVCGKICDNCLDGEKEYKDITIESQKFLSSVLRCEERFGQGYIIDVLRGSNAKRILDFGHDKLSVYGIGSYLSKQVWASIADTLFDIEAIIVNGEYRTLSLTNIGYEILKKQKTVQIDSSHLEEEKQYNEYTQEIKKDETFEKFRILRTKLSQEQNIAAYQIFGDKTLQEISFKLPATHQEFLTISGVGQSKLDKYADIFIELSKSLREDGVKIKKVLTKTYLQTLELIKQNKTLDEICEIRELKDPTIASHINELYENEYITKDEKDKIFEPLKENFPKDIKIWLEEGLKNHDISTLRQNLNKYSYLFMDKI
ncbi:MAG: DNA helicase RecQ [Campylobacterota bacterium]|nr:DNA helicase RecQ [Campylobacterota bacterium]